MKHLFLGLALLTTVQATAQNVYTATYTAGDILSDMDFQTLPGTSICPASLTVPVPAGAFIDSARVTYSFFSSFAGFGSPTQQRSWIRCLTTGQDEAQMALVGAFVGTTANYSRPLNLANGVSTGPVEFQMHPGNTGLFGGNCSNYHYIVNNTWTITVFTSGSTDISAAPAADVKLWLDGADRLHAAGLSDAPATVRVLDALGRVLVERTIRPERGALDLSLPSGPAGVIVVLVDQEGSRLERRVARL